MTDLIPKPKGEVERIPRRLGRYEIAVEIARGGFGSVHLARVIGPGAYEKFVALKLVHPHLYAHPDFVTMFLDEARVAASLSHPNICSAIDFGEVDGVLYLAMEFLIGEPLSRLQRVLSRGKAPITPTERSALVCRLLADAAEGLHALHESVGADGKSLGAVHRDVSPPNLFVRYDGSTQVMDFGVAKTAGQMHVTQAGIAKGHMAYVAPEQLAQRNLDRRVDVWSLGVVLWELLTGRLLFERHTIESTLFAIAGETPPPPSSIDPDVPRALDRIVARALRRDPAERFATTREMGAALVEYVHESAVPMGAGQVARWMDRLVPGGRAHRQALLARARETLGPARRAESPHRTIQRISSRPPPGMGAQVVRPPPRVDPTAPPPSRRRRPPRLHAAAILTGTCLVLLLTAASSGVLRGGFEARGDDRLPDPVITSDSALCAGPSPVVATQDATEAGADEPGTAAPAAPGVPTSARQAGAALPAGPRPIGHVNVVTPGGWAEIVYAGRRYGQTPARLALPAGRRRLTLLPWGRGEPETVDVVVEPQRVVPVVIPLGDRGGPS